jgi:uncharacterized protein DUF5818
MRATNRMAGTFKLAAVVAGLAVLCLVAQPLTAAAAATAGSWTGWVTDESCGATGAKAEHKACAEKCVKKGDKLVFYNTADQKLYKLDNQDLAMKNVGHEVVVKGKVDGTAIAVDSIEAAPKAK